MDTVLAWAGPDPDLQLRERCMLLWKSTWTNPNPSNPVVSIDVVASEKRAPFLLAVTVE